MDYLRSEGWHIIGSSHLTDKNEYDRAQGEELAKSLGLKIAPKVEFDDFGKAKKYLEKLKQKENNLKLVFKGDGIDLAGGAKTYLANTVEEMIKYFGWLEKKQQSGECKIEKFGFHQVIEGLEVDFAAWFNGERFAPSLFVDFEQKRIHGLGRAEGCLGNIIFFLDPKKQPYFNKYLSKLLPKIKGDVATEWSINNIIEKDTHEPYFLEFTPRFGYDSMMGEFAILQDAGRSIGEFLINIAFRIPFPKGFFPYNRYSCAVRFYCEGVGAPSEDVKGKPVFWDKRIEDNLWWYSIKKSDDENYEITSNPVGVAVFVDSTVEGAIKKTYDIITPKKNYLVLPDIFYSETIGEKVPQFIKTLKQWKIIA
jgi:phosphoribosylamine-glycine ligase